MKYLITRKEHFKNERLSKNLKTITIGTYDKLLGISIINEILDTNLNRIKYIINDLVIKKKIQNSFCIGVT